MTNINIIDEQWRQANLLFKPGGIGVRSVTAIAPSAFYLLLTSSQAVKQSSSQAFKH